MKKIYTPRQRRSLADLNDKLHNLPQLKVVVSRVLALNPDDDNYFDEILELCEADPSFAVRIIRLSNSACSLPANPITKLQQAISRLGTRQVSVLVMSMAMMRLFTPTTEAQCKLWTHVMETAVSAKTIAVMAGHLNIDPNEAYLCGLLHDIGRFIMFDDDPQQVGRADETKCDTTVGITAAERALCGFDHAELGFHAAIKWELPPVIAKVIRDHHCYGSVIPKPDEPVKIGRLIRIVQLADLFSIFLMKNPDCFEWEAEVFEEKIQKKCINPLGEESPLSASRLHSQAQNIYEKSMIIVSGLGICAV